MKSHDAWMVAEYVGGRAQTQIAAELGCTSAVVCSAIVRFCAEMGFPVQFRLYNEERLNAACDALDRYRKNGGRLAKPCLRKLDEAFLWARAEHAWLLRAEGLPYEEIARRFGVSKERARQIVKRFGRRVVRATRRTHWHCESPMMRGEA
jgi:hypothetical protein